MCNRTKTLTGGIVVIAICVSTSSAVASQCEEKVRAFLKSPSEHNYVQMAGSETSKAASDCWSVIGENRENRDRITGLAAAGNPWAIRFVAINLKALGGGDLEDASIILGEASHSASELLLSLAADGTISDRELGDATVRLPEKFVDKKDEQINELRLRVQSFEAVRNHRLSELRSYVLKELLNHIREVENAGSE